MIYRSFAALDTPVSLLSLGTVKLGRTEGVKYPTTFQLPNDREARSLLDHAKTLGVNLLDTAPAYGESETRLGNLIRGDHDWLLMTKVGEEFDRAGSHYDFSPEHTRASVERSLQRLGRERIDICLIHSNGDDERILSELGTLDMLRMLVGEGKLGAIGISVKSRRGLQAALSHGVDAIMATANPAYTEEADAFPEAQAKGVGIFVKKALASGHADANEALDYVASLDGVTSVVIGTINSDHLAQNCQRLLARAQSR